MASHPTVPIGPRDIGELAHLLFEWPIRQAPRLALPLCILLAAVVQAGMMVVFSISYRTPVQNTPDAPQVYFLPADSAAARQLAPWLEANDPAVFSPQHAAREALPPAPPLNYRPSYEEPPPPLRPLPPMTPPPLEPPSFPLTGRSPMRRSGAPKTSAPRLSAQVEGSVARWQDDLAGRVAIEAPGESKAPPGAPVSAQPALYQVSVGPEGIPRHCVLLESSGDPSSDEAGRVWILSRRFQQADRITWGRVLLLWGPSRGGPPPR